MKHKTKKILILLTTIILILSINITPAAQSIGSATNFEPLHYMGAKPDSQENIKKHLLPEDRTRSISLPSSVDNSHLYPTPMNQTQSDCVAYAIGYAQMAGMQALNRNWTVNTAAHKFSPSFLYNVANNGVDNGLIFGEGMSAAINYGVCPITYYSADNAYNASIPSLAYEAALLYKPSTYHVTSTLTQIKQALVEGKGVAITVWVYPELYYYMTEKNNIYDDDSGDIIDGHAICLVGYDDAPDKQAFKFINSWGENWCEDGYGWISYDLVASDNVNMAGACHGYIMNFSETDNYVMGDANLDNAVTVADSRLALRFSSGAEPPTDKQYVLTDVDGDGKLTEADVRNILNYSAGIITKFPIYE